MGKYELRVRKIETVKDKNGNLRQVTTVNQVEKPVPCAECKKNPRRATSRFCQDCSNAYANEELMRKRREAKIAEAAKH